MNIDRNKICNFDRLWIIYDFWRYFFYIVTLTVHVYRKNDGDANDFFFRSWMKSINVNAPQLDQPREQWSSYLFLFLHFNWGKSVWLDATYRSTCMVLIFSSINYVRINCVAIISLHDYFFIFFSNMHLNWSATSKAINIKISMSHFHFLVQPTFACI